MAMTSLCLCENSQLQNLCTVFSTLKITSLCPQCMQGGLSKLGAIICTFFPQILTTISLLVIVVVDAAAVAVVVVVVVVVFDTGFLPLGDAVMIPISCPTVCLAGDVITMSSGLWLLGNNLGLDQTGVFLSNFAINAVACCKNREYKPLVMSLHKNFIRVPKEKIYLLLVQILLQGLFVWSVLALMGSLLLLSAWLVHKHHLHHHRSHYGLLAQPHLHCSGMESRFLLLHLWTEIQNMNGVAFIGFYAFHAHNLYG